MTFTADAKALETAVSGVISASLNRSTHKHVGHLELLVSGDCLTLTCIDNVILAQRSISISEAEDGACEVDPDSLLACIASSASVRVSLSGDELHITHSGREYALPICHSNLPDYTRFKPDYDHMTRVCIKADTLRRALQSTLQGNSASYVLLCMDSDHPEKPMIIISETGDRAIARTSPL